MNIKVFDIFPWNKNFDTGIDEIDIQHRKLVDILNKLATHLAAYSSELELCTIFDELVDYTDYHFRTEEVIWSKYFGDDEWYLTHEATHETFISELLEIKANQTAKPIDAVIYEIISFLSKWLAYHIVDTDKRMAKVVLAIDKGNSVEKAKQIASEEMSGSTKLVVNAVLMMYDSLSTRTLDLMREKALREKAEAALSRSEERWKFILEGGVDNVWDWDIKNNQLSSPNDKEGVFDVIDKKLLIQGHEGVYPRDVKRVRNEFEAHMRGETEFYSCKYRVIRKTGGWTWYLSRGKVVERDAQGNPLRMIGTHIDVTERELAQLIFTNSSQAIMISDINNNMIAVNHAFTKITGYEADEVIGKNPKILSSHKHEKEFFRQMWRSIYRDGEWSGEVVNRHKNGATYTELLMINTIKDEYGNIDHYFAIFDDITDKKRVEELILRHANYDMLTKLYNRRMFQESLLQEIKLAERNSSKLALLFIDLDHFKNVNDTFGHEIGDQLLVQVSSRICEQVRKSDIVSRIGGDEFTVILSDVSGVSGVESVVQNILNDLQRPFELDINQIQITASIGITCYPHDGDEASDLLNNADQAMYMAKEMGRNDYRFFTNAMQIEAQRRRVVINDLHKAFSPNQFEVYYQPIINLANGEVSKAEALVRWIHPEYGFLLPDEFIPYAEESGLIVKIGAYVYAQALKEVKYWQEISGRKIQVSVNKSPAQLHLEGTTKQMIDTLEDMGLDRDSCIIEITEGMLMKQEHGVGQKLAKLRQAGIMISLDDFGTGYSSLSYLQKYEIDFIKIDKSFIANLERDKQDVALCEAMISMAHKLGIKVIAEGIETEQQKEILKAIKCDYGQGYLFARPVPAESFIALLKN